MLEERLNKTSPISLKISGRFLNEGQHDVYVEIWSAPGPIARGEVREEGWRDKMVCIAISTQMALWVSMDVNMRKGKEQSKL